MHIRAAGGIKPRFEKEWQEIKRAELSRFNMTAVLNLPQARKRLPTESERHLKIVEEIERLERKAVLRARQVLGLV